ncbi:MAG TPA: Smr/MutS family protein [Opitutaceae bacterium]|nr:Smr/MutS family protein [Opitutaceae bacterium]
MVHGKGTGTLREIVHHFCRSSPIVLNYCIGDENSGGWGATRVTLLKVEKRRP